MGPPAPLGGPRLAGPPPAPMAWGAGRASELLALSTRSSRITQFPACCWKFPLDDAQQRGAPDQLPPSLADSGQSAVPAPPSSCGMAICKCYRVRFVSAAWMQLSQRSLLAKKECGHLVAAAGPQWLPRLHRLVQSAPHRPPSPQLLTSLPVQCTGRCAPLRRREGR